MKLQGKWRLSPESNRGTRLCRPLHNHSATQPLSRPSTPPTCFDYPQSANHTTIAGGRCDFPASLLVAVEMAARPPHRPAAHCATAPSPGRWSGILDKRFQRAIPATRPGAPTLPRCSNTADSKCRATPHHRKLRLPPPPPPPGRPSPSSPRPCCGEPGGSRCANSTRSVSAASGQPGPG